MPESEFQIIEHYFKQEKYNSDHVIKGIGDDAAVLDVSKQSELIISVDTLVSGVHFSEDSNAYDIAYKALAVNLSDLAAMGATPAWFTLALTLPNNDSTWLKSFSQGLFHLAEQHNVDLISGDTTHGPLSISIQIAGYADDKIMYRDGAQIDDDIYVTGTIGDAGAGLLLLNESSNLNDSECGYLISRLHQPTPQISVAKYIAKFATSCIDISDGLIADLSHITELSNCGAMINVDALPISKELKKADLTQDCYQLALSAGDDYELCFTAPAQLTDDVNSISNKLNVAITKIGKIVSDKNLSCYFDNQPYHIDVKGYEHFKEK